MLILWSRDSESFQNAAQCYSTKVRKDRYIHFSGETEGIYCTLFLRQILTPRWNCSLEHKDRKKINFKCLEQVSIWKKKKKTAEEILQWWKVSWFFIGCFLLLEKDMAFSEQSRTSADSWIRQWQKYFEHHYDYSLQWTEDFSWLNKAF